MKFKIKLPFTAVRKVGHIRTTLICRRRSTEPDYDLSHHRSYAGFQHYALVAAAPTAKVGHVCSSMSNCLYRYSFLDSFQYFLRQFMSACTIAKLMALGWFHLYFPRVEGSMLETQLSSSVDPVPLARMASCCDITCWKGIHLRHQLPVPPTFETFWLFAHHHD